MAKLEATARTLTQHWLKARIYGMLFEVGPRNGAGSKLVAKLQWNLSLLRALY